LCRWAFLSASRAHPGLSIDPDAGVGQPGHRREDPLLQFDRLVEPGRLQFAPQDRF
jgi:hypothetical protein